MAGNSEERLVIKWVNWLTTAINYIYGLLLFFFLLWLMLLLLNIHCQTLFFRMKNPSENRLKNKLCVHYVAPNNHWVFSLHLAHTKKKITVIRIRNLHAVSLGEQQPIQTNIGKLNLPLWLSTDKRRLHSRIWRRWQETIWHWERRKSTEIHMRLMAFKPTR